MNEPRNHKMWEEYLAGATFSHLGRKYKLSAGRVAELMHKQENKMIAKKNSWDRFQCEMLIKNGEPKCFEQCGKCKTIGQDEFWEMTKQKLYSLE